MSKKKSQCNSLLLKCGKSLVTSFQRIQNGKDEEGTNITVEKHGKHYLSQVIKITIEVAM